jgi:periplasmic protein TonB
MRLLPIIAITASLTAASALAQDASAWEQKLIAHLNKYKRNTDHDAVVVIKFAIDRAGHLVSAKVEKTSGDVKIDKDALVMMRRAGPLPVPPPSLGKSEPLYFVVPIRFSVR